MDACISLCATRRLAAVVDVFVSPFFCAIEIQFVLFVSPLPSFLLARRANVLQVCRKTPMSEEAREVALARVARSPKAEAFTGADLQAVVDTAQLAAIHSYLEVKIYFAVACDILILS